MSSDNLEIQSERLGRGARCLLWSLIAGVFTLGMVLYTRHNDLPLRFHADEPSKALQVLDSEWNFFHPQLMLTTVRALRPWVVGPLPPAPAERADVGAPRAPAEPAGPEGQAVVELGRWVSATFGSLALVLGVVSVWWLYGRMAALAAALILPFSHTFFVASHFMKEDTSLLLGMAASFGAAVWLERRRDLKRVIVLGIGLGLAASGKYVGLLLIPCGAVLVVALMWGCTLKRKARAVGVLLQAVFLTGLLVNYELLFHPQEFILGVAFEVKHVVTAHKNVMRPILGTHYLRVLWQETTPAVLILGLVGVVWHAVTWKQCSAVQRVLAALPLVWLLLMQLTPIQGARYVLPTIMSLYLLSGISVVWIASAVTRHVAGRWTLATVFSLLVTSHGVWTCLNYIDRFSNDSRKQLQRWVQEHLPEDARIAQDWYAGLRSFGPDAEPRLVKTKWYVVEGGGLKGLLDDKITHVVVCDTAYGRFLDAGRKPGKSIQSSYRMNREAYLELFERGRLMWSYQDDPGFKAWTNTSPGLRVYALPAE